MISNQSLTCPKGTSLTFEIDMDTGSDLTGATAQWALAESWFDQAKVYLTKSGTGDGLFIGQDAGIWKITVNLAPGDTLDVPSGLLYHDCKVLLQSGDVEDVANGPFSLDPSVNILDTNAPITRNLRSVPQPLGRLGQVTTLTVGQLARNLLATQTLAPIGQTATATGGSSSLSAQTIQFFDRLITMPSASRQTAYSTLIDALVSGGVWTKLDVLFMTAAADAATGLTNLVQEPHRGFLDTTAGTPTFTTDRGWSATGAAGNKDVNTNFNPSTAAGNYTQNDAMICVWVYGSTQENAAIVMDPAGDAKVELFNKWSDGNSYWAINGNGTEISSVAPSNPGGFWLMERTGASACELHNNNTLIGTSTNGSAALINQNICSGSVANSIACLGIGASLSSGQQTALYNAALAYMTAVGVV